MILLDTNVVSELMKPAPDDRVRAWLLGLHATPLAIAVVTVAEIEYGLRRLPPGRRRESLMERFGEFTDAISILPLDDVAARESGRLRALREAAGRPSTPSDMMIAGIATVADAALATRNARDFEGLALTLIDPWSAD